jgi:predicted ATPase
MQIWPICTGAHSLSRAACRGTDWALRTAAEMARGFPDGAWLVLLAPVQDSMLVPQTVFGALGVHDLSAGASLSSLTEYLAGRRLLLMLDNCEHLLDGCATLAAALIRSCPARAGHQPAGTGGGRSAAAAPT